MIDVESLLNVVNAIKKNNEKENLLSYLAYFTIYFEKVDHSQLFLCSFYYKIFTLERDAF